jgi:hypothetical protein
MEKGRRVRSASSSEFYNKYLFLFFKDFCSNHFFRVCLERKPRKGESKEYIPIIFPSPRSEFHSSKHRVRFGILVDFDYFLENPETRQ